MSKDKYDKSNQSNLEKISSQSEKYSKDAKYMDQVAIETKKKLRENLDKNKK